MRISPIFAIVVREYYLMRASIARIVPLFVWSAIDIVLWGFLTRFLSGLVPAGFNAVTVLLGAILLWNFLIRIMQGVSTTFLEDVWTRNFLNVFSSPITIAEYLSGLVISSIIMSIIGVIVMLSIATIGFGLSIFVYGVLLIPFVIILFIFGIALGIAGSAIVLRLGSSAEWFIWPIPAVISPFVGVLYPLSILPPWMQAIGRLLPPSYVFEGMRTVIAGGGISSASLLTGFILSVLSIFIACGFFVYVFRYAVRTGLLARFSAEST
jgi:ABC-2 type transport system permease protein